MKILEKIDNFLKEEYLSPVMRTNSDPIPEPSLTVDEINRLKELFAKGPSIKQPIDDKLLQKGMIRHYAPNNVEIVPNIGLEELTRRISIIPDVSIT